MANSKQRNKNRETARRLAEGTFYCPECGKAEAHWIGPLVTKYSMQFIVKIAGNT